jgi:hypothetical protein
MEANKNNAPKPDAEEYDVENPQNLNVPKFNSTTDKLEGREGPAVENFNDQIPVVSHEQPPKADLGNDREDDENEQERIISK